MIEWKPEFEIGIKAIDVHHKVLVRTFNEFEAALETDAVSRRTIQEILLFLQHYASWHFSREEEVAECYHCPHRSGQQERPREVCPAVPENV